MRQPYPMCRNFFTLVMKTVNEHNIYKTPEGIDYTHEMFRNSAGNSKIAVLWDQTF